MAEIDVSELLGLVRYLDNAEHEAARRTHPVVERHAKALGEQWRKNARATARRHGKRYPSSITAGQVPTASAIEWEIGPESMLPQGGMGRGFEYGSRNQPPHWDGARAAIQEEPKFVASIDEVVRSLL
ncbi:hypothetical protein [Nonomuraea typhae]|uniref:hypothetical protein n=1 Tax=Nonomuraea typhae TaxID=2603600 RepID=UPI0012F92F56|nr:hypothetical protein [Nonomuraea typhae]